MTMSKVWVYQSDRKLTDQETQNINNRVREFLQQWQAHGQPLDADFDILHGLFLVLKVDERQAAASGCSIDKSVALFKEIEQTHGIHLFDRQQFAYEKDGEVCNDHLANLDSLVNKGIIDNNTIVFNNLVETVDDYQSRFRVPFGESWHKRLLSNDTVLS